MKRKFMSALLIVAATCFTVSCEKDDKDNQSNTNSKFSGTIEQLASDAKTELGDNDIVKWNPNDTITVNNGHRLIATITDPSTTTGFAFVGGEGTLDDASYTAYYPASIYNGGTPTLPAVQQYTARHIDNLPMYAFSNSTTLQFHNICGVVELTLKGDKTVSSIDVSSASTALCGAFTVTNNAAVITAAASADNKKVTLDCGAGAQLDEEGTKFWVAIPAGEHKLTFCVNATDGSYSEFTTRDNVTVKANYIYFFEKTPGFEESVASGPFMGANGRTLYFAKGNLKSESNSYKFYDDQLTSDYDGTFSWTTVNNLTASQRTIEGHEWNVPTADDWNVIIGNQRDGSIVNGTPGCRYALATFGSTKGLLLCPDGKEITIEGLASNVNWNEHNQYSNAMLNTVWEELEEAGFVFLPKPNTSSSSVFYYWTSSQVDNNNATAFKIGNASDGCTNVTKSKSELLPVRMVLVQ